MGQQDLFKPRQSREERLEWEPCALSQMTHCRGMADTVATGRTRQSSCRFLVPENQVQFTEFTSSLKKKNRERAYFVKRLLCFC